MAVMQQKLLEEGQQYVAFANEARVDNDKDEVLVFTTDGEGEVVRKDWSGYLRGT